MSDAHRVGVDGLSAWMHAVLKGPVAPMLMLVTLVIGMAALWVTPREEEPQIVVPMADVIVSAPGLGARQMERQVTQPLENLLYQIDGVEYVYAMTRANEAVVTVRFFVGEDREDALVRIYNKLYSNADRIPEAVAAWSVKPVEVDDVPIVVAMLWSADPQRSSDHELRRIAEEVAHELQSIENTNKVEVIGGRPRVVRVELDPQALAARRTAALDVAWAIQVSNQQRSAGHVEKRDASIAVEVGTFFPHAEALKAQVINVIDGIPVYLRDVATVHDGPAQVNNYTWIGFGPAANREGLNGSVFPAVAISVAKKKGTNAVQVARDVQARLHQLDEELFPDEVHFHIIRNYGATANQKVNDLVTSLAVAILTVVVFIGMVLGWRAALLVGLAVPVCYGVTLAMDFAAGYTINRVTLFALILALGLLVDDPITGIDNITRYLRIGGRDRQQSIVAAMVEIRGALVMSTIAIVFAFAPLFFITGMMGPYMAPMAFNVPISVIASTVVAFIVTPWLALRLLPDGDSAGAAYDVKRTPMYRLYSAIIRPLIASRARGFLFMGVIMILFVVAVALPLFRLVPLKLLPYDNKDEFQIVIDMPEGTSLERTEALAHAFADYLGTVPEVESFSGFVGVASPMDFNAMVRHYYLRNGTHQADVRVTLVERKRRAFQSHEVVLRLRRDLERISKHYGADIKLVEVPPGPPVIATVAVELYGTAATPYDELTAAATQLAQRLRREPLVVDVDSSAQAHAMKLNFVTDKEKAALSGVSTRDVVDTLALATAGMKVDVLELPNEVNPLSIELRLPIEQRSDPHALKTLYLKGQAGIAKVRERGGVRDAPQPLVQLGELGEFITANVDTTRYRKNLKPVAYVFAELAGRAPADVIADITADRTRATGDSQTHPVREPEHRTFISPGGGDQWALPATIRAVWTGEGEWDITVRVFRDLGIAFAAALLGIYLVLYVQTGLSALALLIMVAIPLSMIGIMPGFWLLNVLTERTVDGFPNPVLFTATAMIGMIALAGIVVRNSLILVEFIRLALREGHDVSEALIQAGAVRTRPVVLTAGTTLLGNLVITLDPIFSGLAWAIIFGVLASTVFTLLVIPVLYYLAYASQTPPSTVLPNEVDA